MSRGRIKSTVFNWEIIFRDEKGEYIKAYGIQSAESFEIEFFRKGEIQCVKKVQLRMLYQILKWDKEQKVMGGISARKF